MPYTILPIPSDAPTTMLTPTLPPGYVQEVGHKWIMYEDYIVSPDQVFFIDYLEADPLYMIFRISSSGYRVGVASDPLTAPVPTPTTYKLWYYTPSTLTWTDYYFGNLVQSFPSYPTTTEINHYMYGTGSVFTDVTLSVLMVTNGTSTGPTYPDLDGDGIPDYIDIDIDGDTIINIEDDDMDGDGIPNFQDTDNNDDGIPDTSDLDFDGITNDVDDDDDNDGIPDLVDPDNDGFGEPDLDMDGDGIANEVDPDIDGDGLANADDPDMDGDGVLNEDDADKQNDGILDVIQPNEDIVKDIIADADPTTLKTGMSMNNYYALEDSQVGQLKVKIWGLTIPFFTKPSEALLSLIAFPFDLTTISNTTGGSLIGIGNTTLDLVTTVYEVDPNYNSEFTFGQLTLTPYYGNFLDLAPNTHMFLYLPFIGERQVDPNYFYSRLVEVKYFVNLTNGSFIACVYSDGYMIYRYNGLMGQIVPLTQVDNPLLEATIATTVQAGGMALANPVAGATSAVMGAVNNVVNGRPSISGSSGGGGEAEWSMPMDCYIRIEIPVVVEPTSHRRENGKPLMLTRKLGDLKGYTTMINPNVICNCTKEENDKINSLLKEGVIING